MGHRRFPGRALQPQPTPTRGQSAHPDLRLDDRAQSQRPQQGQDLSGAEEEPESPLANLRIIRASKIWSGVGNSVACLVFSGISAFVLF